MKDVLAFFGIIIGVTVLGTGAAWLIQGNDFFMYRMFAPQYEQVRRETFEQSKAYRQGSIQELQSMQFQWAQADDAHKVALADLILHRAADFDENVMPNDLRSFIEQLRRDRTSQR